MLNATLRGKCAFEIGNTEKCVSQCRSFSRDYFEFFSLARRTYVRWFINTGVASSSSHLEWFKQTKTYELFLHDVWAIQRENDRRRHNKTYNFVFFLIFRVLKKVIRWLTCSGKWLGFTLFVVILLHWRDTPTLYSFPFPFLPSPSWLFCVVSFVFSLFFSKWKIKVKSILFGDPFSKIPSFHLP